MNSFEEVAKQPNQPPLRPWLWLVANLFFTGLACCFYFFSLSFFYFGLDRAWGGHPIPFQMKATLWFSSLGSCLAAVALTPFLRKIWSSFLQLVCRPGR